MKGWKSFMIKHLNKKINIFNLLFVLTVSFILINTFVFSDDFSYNAFADETDGSGNNNTAVDNYHTQVVTLTERYNGDYETYEESIGDMFYFYSNVANGAISDGDVVLDIPSNIKAEFEKDGAPIEAKSTISKKGNYVVRLSCVYENFIYISTFRFSIREKKEELHEVDTAGEADINENAENDNDVINNDTQDLNAENDNSDENVTDGNSEITNIQDEDIDINELLNGDLDLNENITDEEIDAMIENAGLNLEGNSDKLNDSDYMFCGFNQEYSDVYSNYIFTLKSGDIILSSIPNGAIVNDDVMLTLPDGMTGKVYRDGILLEDVTEYTFKKGGFYHIVFESTNVNYMLEYPEEKDKPYLNFFLLKHGTKNMKFFNAPLNMHIKEIRYGNGYLLDDDGAKIENVNYYEMKNDGVYEYSIVDEEAKREYTVEVNIDHQAPKFKVNYNSGGADIIYESNDIDYLEVKKNGTLLNLNDPTKIKGNGKYVVSAYDYAGNKATVSFEIKNAFNTGTFISILLFILLLGSGFVFFRLVRTSINVR